jgi:hypothetical protein
VTTSHARVPVNEDFLFDVDILTRELAPVYWHGPVYEVRRGTWFYQEGSSLRPCEENLAAQLEEGYLKTKPWLSPTVSASADMGDSKPGSATTVRTNSPERGTADKDSSAPSLADKPAGAFTPPPQPPSYRLFGTYMNSVATYQDATTAWVSSDSIISWVTSNVYQRFAGGGYMGGVKLVRGYPEPGKAKDNKRPRTPPERTATPKLDEKEQKAMKRKSAPPSTRAALGSIPSLKDASSPTDSDSGRLAAEIRQREEDEIREDYNFSSDESQGRDIEHLVLVTHGIGQLLSLR